MDKMGDIDAAKLLKERQELLAKQAGEGGVSDEPTKPEAATETRRETRRGPLDRLKHRLLGPEDTHLEDDEGEKPKEKEPFNPEKGVMARLKGWIQETFSKEEKEEIKKEIESMSKEDKEKLSIGLNNLGFIIEKKKNNGFTKIIDSILNARLAQTKKESDPKKAETLFRKSTVYRFYSAARNKFARDAKAADLKAKDPSVFTDAKLGLTIKGKKRGISISGEKQRELSNIGLLFGNVARYGRAIFDLTTRSFASPLRYVTMAAMAFSSGADIAKEARLANEEVIDKTRIENEEKAAEEAWEIYKKAMGGDLTKEVSAEKLQEAYMSRLPKDLIERLSREPGTATSLIQKIIKLDLGGAIKRLSAEIEEIENDTKLNPEQKESKKKALLKRQERNLLDYDRILTQYGTVDGLAIAGRYAKAAGNAAVWVTTAETIALSAQKIWENLSHALSNEGVMYEHEAGLRAAAHARVQSHQIYERMAPVTPEPAPSAGGAQPAEAVAAPVGAPVTPGAGVASGTPESIIPEAVIHRGEGIEHAFIRQIEHNPQLQTELGFKPGDDLHSFAQRQAHLLATRMGYVDGVGNEVRVLIPDKVSYEIKFSGGHITGVEERMIADGSIVETHGLGTSFEQSDVRESYEYPRGSGSNLATGPGPSGEILPPAPRIPNIDIPNDLTAQPGDTDVIRPFEPGEAATIGEHGLNNRIPFTSGGSGHPIEPPHGYDEANLVPPTNPAYDHRPVGYRGEDSIRTGNGDIRTFTQRPGVRFESDNGPIRPSGSEVGGRTFTTHTGVHFQSDNPYRNWGGYRSYGFSRGAHVLHEIGNPYGLSEADLDHVSTVFNSAVHDIFPADMETAWADYSTRSAADLLNTPPEELAGDGPMSRLVNYLREVRRETGVNPGGRTLLFGKAEGVEKWLFRALQSVARRPETLERLRGL